MAVDLQAAIMGQKRRLGQIKPGQHADFAGADNCMGLGIWRDDRLRRDIAIALPIFGQRGLNRLGNHIGR